uniref:leucine--tRNA ligase n=1 Tax=Piliocolobus tephrosceles TaxID=591936 RepID=A0A8C9GYM3_9PRIM
MCAYILDNNKCILFIQEEGKIIHDTSITNGSGGSGGSGGESKNSNDNIKKRSVAYNLLAYSPYSKSKSIYNLRDWLFSRQRYWGEPFPFLYRQNKSGKTNDKKNVDKSSDDDDMGNNCSSAKSRDDKKLQRKIKTKKMKIKKIKTKKMKTKKIKTKKIKIKKIKNSALSNVYIDKIPTCLPPFNKKIYEQKNEITSLYDDRNAHTYAENKVYSILSKFPNWIYQKRNKNVLYKRECDIMPQWAGSSWYYLRYIDPKNKKKIFKKKMVNFWLPVDLYVGGSEHAVLHLLYARFFHKFLYDLKLIKHKEPFKKLFNQGIILSATKFYVYTNLQNEFVSYEHVQAEINKKIDADYAHYVCENGENYKQLASDNVALNKTDNTEKRGDIYKLVNSFNYSLINNIYKKYEIDEKYVVKKKEKYYLKNDCSIEIQADYDKMSKSKGNVVNPIDIVKIYGSDCLRLHILFLGPIEQDKKWTLKGINGSFHFLENLYNLFVKKKKKKGNIKISSYSVSHDMCRQKRNSTSLKTDGDNIICKKCIKQKKINKKLMTLLFKTKMEVNNKEGKNQKKSNLPILLKSKVH